MTPAEICALLDERLDSVLADCRRQVGGRSEDFNAAMTGFFLNTSVAVAKSYGVPRETLHRAFRNVLKKHYEL